jgi:hypothetical protein
LLLAGVFATTGGWAQAQSPTRDPNSASPAQVQLSTQVSAEQVEVGERVVVSVTILSSQGDTPSNPRLTVDGPAEINGPSLRSEFRMFSDGHSLRRQQGVTATWTVTPTRAGQLSIGPGTFQLGGKTVSGERVTVRVVPPSGAPRRSPTPPGARGGAWPDPFGFDPFDWLRRRRPPGMDADPFEDLLEPRVPPELRVDRAPDPTGFARMDAVPKKVVVGEQVTLRVYAYGGRGPFSVGFASQPSTADFLSFPIEQHDLVPHRVPIGDQVFHAAKLREVALIPLRSGALTIGGAELFLSGRGYPATGAQGGFLTRSAPLTIQVVEPPVEGRPPGYVLGDVGRFTLEANVEPRQVREGEFFSVVARLAGTGNVPSRMTPAEHQAFEWHEPVVTGEVEAQGTSVGGERTFRWTVKAKQAGSLDLGELKLPYYDPQKRRYETAHAKLGAVEVLPSAVPQPTEAAPRTLDSSEPVDEPNPRGSLGPWARPAQPWTDHPSFWWVLLGLPLAVPALEGLARGARALSGLKRSGVPNAKAGVQKLLAAAEDHMRDGARSDAAAKFERALAEAVQAATERNPRSLLRDELIAALIARGVEPEQSQEVARLSAAWEEVRFTGAGDVDSVRLTELAARTRAVSESLVARQKKGSR